MAERGTRTITQVVRVGMRGGHPRYRVTFADGSDALTKPEAQVNYGISNSDYRDGPVEVALERGQIIGIRRADGTAVLGSI